jgi:hypothetical protein
MILSELELLTTGNKKDNIVNTEKIHWKNCTLVREYQSENEREHP